MKGNDDFVRSAFIRMSDGLTNRPIAKLYPLELNERDVEADRAVIEDTPPSAHPSKPSLTVAPSGPTTPGGNTRVRRQAATRGLRKMKAWITNMGV